MPTLCLNACDVNSDQVGFNKSGSTIAAGTVGDALKEVDAKTVTAGTRIDEAETSIAAAQATIAAQALLITDLSSRLNSIPALYDATDNFIGAVVGDILSSNYTNSANARVYLKSLGVIVTLDLATATVSSTGLPLAVYFSSTDCTGTKYLHLRNEVFKEPASSQNLYGANSAQAVSIVVQSSRQFGSSCNSDLTPENATLVPATVFTEELPTMVAPLVVK